MAKQPACRPPPEQAVLADKLDQAVYWLENNQDDIDNIQNPILWWMLQQSSEITNHPRLTSFFQDYKSRKLDISRRNIWAPMFEPRIRIQLPPVELLYHFPDYNLLFFYGFTCDQQLGREPEIQRQLDEGFCRMHFLHPRCVTHQIRGGEIHAT